MTEGEKQGETILRIDFERARLGIAQPALRDQVIEEWMESAFANMRRIPAWKGEGNRRMAGRQISGIVGEHATPAGLLTQLACEEIAVVDLAPERRRHINPDLFFDSPA